MLLIQSNVLTHAAKLLDFLDVLVLRLDLLLAGVVSIVGRDHRVDTLVDCVLLVSFTFGATEHFLDGAATTDAFLMLLSPVLLRVLNLLRKYALCRRDVLGGNVCLFDRFMRARVVAIQMLGRLPLIWDVEPAAIPSLLRLDRC